jgi:hypothetical protein
MPDNCAEWESQYSAAANQWANQYAQYSALQQSLSEDASTIWSLGDQLSSLQSQYSELQGQESGVSTEIQTIQFSISSVQNDMSDLQTEIGNVESYLAFDSTTDPNYEYYEFELQQWQSQYLQDQTTLQGLQSQLSYFSQELSMIQSEELSLQIQISTAQSQLSAAQAQQFQDQSTSAQLQSQLTLGWDEINQLTTELDIYCQISEPGVNTQGLLGTTGPTPTNTSTAVTAATATTMTGNPISTIVTQTGTTTVALPRIPRPPWPPRRARSAAAMIWFEERQRNAERTIQAMRSNTAQIRSLSERMRRQQSTVRVLDVEVMRLVKELSALRPATLPPAPRFPSALPSPTGRATRLQEGTASRGLDWMKERSAAMIRWNLELSASTVSARKTLHRFAVIRKLLPMLESAQMKFAAATQEVAAMKAARLNLYVEARSLRESASLALTQGWPLSDNDPQATT